MGFAKNHQRCLSYRCSVKGFVDDDKWLLVQIVGKEWGHCVKYIRDSEMIMEAVQIPFFHTLEEREQLIGTSDCFALAIISHKWVLSLKRLSLYYLRWVWFNDEKLKVFSKCLLFQVWLWGGKKPFSVFHYYYTIIFACVTCSCLCDFNIEFLKKCFYNIPTGINVKKIFYVHAALYSFILFCVFLWIPFVYFYYEERDDDNINKCSVRSLVGSYRVGILFMESKWSILILNYARLFWLTR